MLYSVGMGFGGGFQLFSSLCWRRAVLLITLVSASPGKGDASCSSSRCLSGGVLQRQEGGEGGTGFGEDTAPGVSLLNRCEPIASASPCSLSAARPSSLGSPEAAMCAVAALSTAALLLRPPSCDEHQRCPPLRSRRWMCSVLRHHFPPS